MMSVFQTLFGLCLIYYASAGNSIGNGKVIEKVLGNGTSNVKPPLVDTSKVNVTVLIKDIPKIKGTDFLDPKNWKNISIFS